MIKDWPEAETVAEVVELARSFHRKKVLDSFAVMRAHMTLRNDELVSALSAFVMKAGLNPDVDDYAGQAAEDGLI